MNIDKLLLTEHHSYNSNDIIVYCDLTILGI